METPASTGIILPPSLAIRRRISSRAKRLRLVAKDDHLELVLPPKANERSIERFLQECQSWIIQQSYRLGQRDVAPFQGQDGAEIYYRGAWQPWQWQQGKRSHVSFCPENGFCFHLTEASLNDRAWQVTRLLTRWMKQQAACHAAESLAALSAPDFVTLEWRDPKQRWGSCHKSGRIMLSWRLVMAPPEVMHYVIAHELAHLAHMDHSPAFWQEVARLMPDYAAARAWLKKEGWRLHKAL